MSKPAYVKTRWPDDELLRHPHRGSRRGRRAGPSRVVAEAREAELDEPVPRVERGEAVSDRELERPLGAGDLGEELLARVALVLAPEHHRPELGGRARLGRPRRELERGAARRFRLGKGGRDGRGGRFHRADPRRPV